MNNIQRAMAIAVTQGGVLRRDQALESGIYRSTIGRYVETGRWKRVLRGVYQIVDMDGRDHRVRAAIASLPNAIVSHETAAEMRSIPHLPLGLATVMVHSRTTHVFPGVVVHRAGDIDPGHFADKAGLPVTTLERTLIDLAGKLHPRHLEFIIDDLVAAQRLDMNDLETMVESISRRGKSGSQSLRTLLSERTTDDAGLASRLERLGLKVLTDAGLPMPKTEYRAPWNGTERIDAAYPHAKIGIEWDSKRWHTQVAAFQRDRERDRHALLEGWRIFRFTWQDVTESPWAVVGTLRSALDAAPLPR